MSEGNSPHSVGFQMITVIRSPNREATNMARREAMRAQLGARLAIRDLVIPSLVRLSIFVGTTLQEHKEVKIDLVQNADQSYR